jgi:hypothetical protein
MVDYLAQASVLLKIQLLELQLVCFPRRVVHLCGCWTIELARPHLVGKFAQELKGSKSGARLTDPYLSEPLMGFAIAQP